VKKSDGTQYQPIGGGRVVDKDKGTVYSPNQIDQMKKVSDASRKKSNGLFSFLASIFNKKV